MQTDQSGVMPFQDSGYTGNVCIELIPVYSPHPHPAAAFYLFAAWIISKYDVFIHWFLIQFQFASIIWSF